jgi:hypothetical protein
VTRDEIWLEAVAKSKTETMPEHYAGYKAGYFDAALSRDAEIATLRARVAELEGMVPKWVGDEDRSLDPEMSDWTHVETDEASGLMLMVPPVPAPETKP